MTKARIIIADDNSIIRMDLKEQLTGLGYQVVAEESDAQSAIDRAKLLRPDLVILDVRMPDSEEGKAEGIRAARELTAEKVAPVLLLTAYTDPELSSGHGGRRHGYSSSRSARTSSAGDRGGAGALRRVPALQKELGTTRRRSRPARSWSGRRAS